MLKFTLETVRRVKKVLSIVILLVSFVLVAQAQEDYAGCPPFRVTVEAFDASCYQSGTVRFTLRDTLGNLFDIADSGYTDIRLYVVKGGIDTSFTQREFQDGVAVMTNVDTGDLLVGIEAFCDRPHYNRRVFWDTAVQIASLYQIPTASALNKVARSNNGFGNHPSLNCENTGRVQLKITGGTLPYTVKVTQHGDSTAVLKIVTFNSSQTGQDSLLYNYKDYYTIDSLPPGDWDFYLVDGCGYGLPRTGQIVESINFPKLDYIEVFASSGNFADSNVVKINAYIDQQYDYYTEMLSEYVQYRFIIGDTTGSDVPWKEFPSLRGTKKVLLYDTVDGIHDYCELWDRDITLQYRVNTCNDTLISRTFQYHKPNENNFQKNTSIVTDEVLYAGACSSVTIRHTTGFSIRYNPYNPNNVRRDQDDNVHRYHYTHPLAWTYEDVNGSTLTELKTETVANISTNSTLSISEMMAYYGWSDMCSADAVCVKRTLRDGHGCELYTTTDSLIVICDTISGGPSWEVTQSGNDHCCTERRTVKLSEINSAANDPDGTIVELIQSPYNNRYNFTAIYHSEDRDWDIQRNSMENVALIYGYGNGRALEISDYCLPSGPYTFAVSSSCGRDTITRYVSFPDIYSTELTELPAHISEQHCTDMYITYTAGTVSRVSRNTDPHTGLDKTPQEHNLQTNFSIVSGPVGGYDEGRRYVKNEPIRLSLQGDYIIHIFPNENEASGLCEVPDFFDTIHYYSATVQYQFAYAFLCDESDTVGTAYVKAFNGTPPYTYTLFSGPDKTGDTLGIQTLPADSIASFDTLMNDQSTLSCMIMDDCGAYFYVNFIPRTLAQMNKLWFGDGMKVNTTCEGSTIQVHALEVGNILKYRWYDPDDNLIDTVSSPFLFIERGSANGYYKVEIDQNSCHTSIRDSVLLNVDTAATLEILDDVELCPGEEAELRFIPRSTYLESLNSDSLVLFKVAFENGNGIEIREYAAHSGDTIVGYYTTSTPAKVYPLSIFDHRCDYTHADGPDTVFISVKTSQDLRCTMHTTHDTVCSGGTGHLTAMNTVEPPYVIHWYGDYALTQWLKDDTIMDASDISTYDTADITQRTILYVSIEREDLCPSVNGITTSSMNLHNDTTALVCGQSVRLYDSGGQNGNYQPGQVVKQVFHTTDGLPVTLKFDELNLSQSSHLFVISGSQLHPDSVLYDFTYGSVPPELVVSRADTLTLYFLAGQMGAAGWNAIVEHEPGIAIADVWKPSHVTLRDEVCQSQSPSYDDPYNVVGTVVTAEEVNEAIKSAGTHIFEKVLEGAASHNCDSTITFRLTVNAPPRRDTTVITTSYHLSQNPFIWNGEPYEATGQYTKVFTQDGCDSIEVLTLVVLDVDVDDKDICVGETTSVDVLVSNPTLPWESGNVPSRRAPGDVLCSDGSVMRPDSFLTSDKTAIGVVYYVDRDGVSGKAIALVDCPDEIRWAINNANDYQKIHAATCTQSFEDVLFDMEGMNNTMEILRTAAILNADNVKDYAPAAYFCYHYNPETLSEDPNSEYGWYLPAIGELNYLYGNRAIVNRTLTKLASAGASPLKNIYVYYLASTEYNNNECWHLDYSGHITTKPKGLSNSQYQSITNRYFVRPSIAF